VAEGVPITDEKDVPRDSYLRREVALVLYDRVKANYVGNVVYLDAAWAKDYEDRWIFDANPINSTIILK
jgi:hypothetical protein